MNASNMQKCAICEGSPTDGHISVKDRFISQETFHLATCRDCGFVWTIDAPREEEIGPFYQADNYISLSNRKSNLVEHLYHFARSYMLKQKQRLVEKTTGLNGGRLLDIGAGTGYFLNHMRKAGWDVFGIEKDSDARVFAKDNFGLEIEESRFLFGNAGQSYDAITLWHVLEHLYDLNESMQSIHDRLTDGGSLFIAVPNRTSWDANYFGSNWAPYDVPRHLWHFSPADIERLASKNGFRLVGKTPMYLDAFYASILALGYEKASLATPRGLLIGLRAMFHTLINQNKASSIIYSLQKKNSKAKQ